MGAAPIKGVKCRQESPQIKGIKSKNKYSKLAKVKILLNTNPGFNIIFKLISNREFPRKL